MAQTKISGFKCTECERHITECTEQIFCEKALEEHDQKVREDVVEEIANGIKELIKNDFESANLKIGDAKWEQYFEGFKVKEQKNEDTV